MGLIQFSFVCTRFCAPFGVSRVLSKDHLRLLAPWTVFSQWMLYWWRATGSTARKPFHYIHPLTPSTRLVRPQAPFLIPLV